MTEEQNETNKEKMKKERFVSGIGLRRKQSTVFKDLDLDSTKFNSSLCPDNLEEQKERFLRYGLTPNFNYPRGFSPVKKEMSKSRNKIRMALFKEAKAIIDKVAQEHQNGTNFANTAFGDIISQEKANDYISQFIKAHDLDGRMTVYWSASMVASGKMMWVGPNHRYNKPELRRYSLVIKNAADNLYLREDGIKCLVNHEIGTHYLRFYNDGFQPWFRDRKDFGLRPGSSRASSATEEGLATINTLLSARSKYLWAAAITYYMACKGAEMSFRQLYDHMAPYVPDKNVRWKQVVRVKRGVEDVSKPGGFGQDQVYFEGAVEILRNIDNIDFPVLFSGRICWDEVSRVRRMARMSFVKQPIFIRDLQKYKHMLHHIAYINGLGPKPNELITKPVRTKSDSSKAINLQPKTKPSDHALRLLNFNFQDSPVVHANGTYIGSSALRDSSTCHESSCSSPDLDSDEESISPRNEKRFVYNFLDGPMASTSTSSNMTDFHREMGYSPSVSEHENTRTPLGNHAKRLLPKRPISSPHRISGSRKKQKVKVKTSGLKTKGK